MVRSERAVRALDSEGMFGGSARGEGMGLERERVVRERRRRVWKVGIMSLESMSVSEDWLWVYLSWIVDRPQLGMRWLDTYLEDRSGAFIPVPCPSIFTTFHDERSGW